MRRNLRLLLLVGLACATVVLAPAAAVAEEGEPPPPIVGANNPAPGHYTAHETIPGSLGSTGSTSSTRGGTLDPNEYICVWVRQVDSEGYEYTEPIPAGQEGEGQHMNQICGKRSQVLTALGQPDPAAYLMDNCDAPCGALYGQYLLNPPTPREQALELLANLHLAAPTELHTSPDSNRLFVRFPTWFWVDGGEGVTEPITRATPDGAVSIKAVPRFEWSTGEGDTVTCPAEGTPYDPSRFDAAEASPDCGHTYRRPGRFTLTLSVNWSVSWYHNDVFQEDLEGQTYTVSEDIAVNEIQGIVTDVR